jgi:dipeptidyl-peptidase-4
VKQIFVVGVLMHALMHGFAQEANYKAAAKYDVPNLQRQVGSLEIVPQFINKSDSFWFAWQDAQGNRLTWFVNPVTEQKRLLKERPEWSGGSVPRHHIIGSASPDRQWQLYSRGHNLYLNRVGDSADTRLSDDGEPYYSFCINEADNATTQNIASDAEWLPDGKHFYALREDNRRVQTISLTHTMASGRSWVETKKYQFPGDAAVTQYELWVGNLETKQFVKVAVVHNKASSAALFFTRRKRTCNEIELCAVDLATGTVRVIINERNPPVINFELFNVRIINGGKDIIWWSDRTGWGHYYLYDGHGRLKGAITKGEWTAGRIVSIDTAGSAIFLYGYGKEPGRNPYLQHLYKVSLAGGKTILLTPENAHHKVFVSPAGNYFVDNYSRIDQAPKTIVRNRRGDFVMDVIQPDLQQLYKYGWRTPEPFIVKAADGATDLYGIMWKPYDFDSTKKYPLISQVYPGPQIETVWPDFTIFDKYNNSPLAQVGFIVVVMGHRGGSPLRNKAYFNFGFGNLRDYALADDKYGLEQLARRHRFIDSTRIGIFGHSGGGAMAATAICTYPDFYKVAVASAGNHDNNIYYRSWGETFHGIREVTDSASGKVSFKFKTAINQTLAKNLKGHLLLVTGEIDNNVLPTHTYRMADALIKAGKDFDMMVLPNQHHHYEGVYKSWFENKTRHYFAKYLIEEYKKDIE